MATNSTPPIGFLEHCHGFLAKRDTGMLLELRTLKSQAGFYIGTLHDELGPVSRESAEYFQTVQQAEEALATGSWTQRSTPGT